METNSVHHHQTASVYQINHTGAPFSSDLNLSAPMPRPYPTVLITLKARCAMKAPLSDLRSNTALPFSCNTSSHLACSGDALPGMSFLPPNRPSRSQPCWREHLGAGKEHGRTSS